MEEFQFPIDRFRAVGSWMAEMERRMNVLEAEARRLDGLAIQQGERIKELEEFRHSVQVVMRLSQQPETQE